MINDQVKIPRPALVDPIDQQGCPLELGLVLRQITAGFASELLDAIRAWSPPGVQRLLERGQDPNQIYCDGRSAVHCALDRRALSCVSVLLEGAADPNLSLLCLKVTF